MTQIVRVKDKDGQVHWAAADADWVRDGLASGDLTDLDAPPADDEREVTDDASAATAPGDDQDTSGTDEGSGDGKRPARRARGAGTGSGEA